MLNLRRPCGRDAPPRLHSVPTLPFRGAALFTASAPAAHGPARGRTAVWALPRQSLSLERLLCLAGISEEGGPVIRGTVPLRVGLVSPGAQVRAAHPGRDATHAMLGPSQPSPPEGSDTSVLPSR